MISRPTLSLRKPFLPLVLGVTLTALLASGVAWSATGKTATVTVDGQSSDVGFRSGTVSDILASQGLQVGEHDLVVPSVTTVLEDGETIALRRGRPLTLVVDGAERIVWVTAGSVDEALDQVGLRGQGLALSASRSRGIPLDGLTLTVGTPKAISILANGATQERTTAVRPSRTPSTRPASSSPRPTGSRPPRPPGWSPAWRSPSSRCGPSRPSSR